MNNQKMGRRLKKQCGLTLIEVMAALAIFAVAALAIVSATGEHIRSLTYLEQKNMALWVANNHLTQLTLDNKFPQLGDKKGNVELANVTWYWQQKVVKTADPKFRSVTIRIMSEEKGDYALAELTTYMASKS